MIDHNQDRPVATLTVTEAVITSAVVDGEEKNSSDVKRIRKDGYLLGKVTRVKGVAVACEVELEDGRLSLVLLEDVEARNDLALEVLTAPGPKVEVHADQAEEDARKIAEDDDFDDADMIDEDPTE